MLGISAMALWSGPCVQNLPPDYLVQTHAGYSEHAIATYV